MPVSVITFLTLVNLLNYLDRYVLAAILPLVSKDLSLTNEESGRLIAAFVFGYFIFSPLFGYLGDRLKRPALMAAGVFCWSLATIGSGLGFSYLSLLIIRVFVGIGEASFATISPGYIKDRISDPAKLNWILSIFFAAIPVGAALGYAVAGFVAASWNWHAVFLVAGIPGLILAPMMLKLKEHRSAPVLTEGPVLAGLKTILAQPVLVYAIAGYAMQAFTLNAIAAFITKYGVELGFGAEKISQIFGLILVVTGLGGTLIGGKISTRLTTKSDNPIRTLFYFCVASSVLGAPCLAAAFLTGNTTLFLIFCFFAEFVVFASTAPINSIIVLSAPPSYITLTQGMTIAAINLIGGLFGPILVGIIADHFSLAIGLQLATVTLIISALVWWRGATATKVIS